MTRMHKRSRAVLLAACLCWLVALATVQAARKPQIDYDALEKAWEAGDTEQELRSVGDEQVQSLAEKSEADAKALGPQMVFVTLRDDSHGAAQKDLTDLASRWKELLWNGGLDVNIYEIEHAKLLVGLQKGIQVDDLHRFLLEQPEVHEFEWNGQTFSASSSRNEKHRRLHDKTSKQQHKKNSKSKSRVHKGDSKSKGAKKQVSATTNEKSEL
uniref:Mesoderm development candidate 2 n=1 Tax=Globisporangium ultimum (strain ATCC 200006 / CBS 805.95 / DAOM BR144) TaxID=431595 RepID=K3X437_GLOUD